MEKGGRRTLSPPLLIVMHNAPLRLLSIPPPKGNGRIGVEASAAFSK